jgi:hypothetical protein
MTSTQLGLLFFLTAALYLYLVMYCTSNKRAAIKRKGGEQVAPNIIKAILIPFIPGFFIISSTFAYIEDRMIEAKTAPLNNAYVSLYQLSKSHKTLAIAYRACSSITPKKTRVSCVREMEDKARYEGLSGDFPIIYNDLKTHIFHLEESTQQ